MTQNTRARRAHLPGSVRLAALVLTALTLCAFLTVRPVQAAEWMTPYLEQVQEWGVMRGDSQGNLHEDRNITRAEFVTLVNRAFGYTEPSPDNPFSDVNPNDWFAEDISIARQAGYFNGTSANTASPYALVTREQAAVLLGRCLRFQGVAGAANSTFTDMQDIGGWSRGLVQEAADLGIIQGYADGSFKPGLPITRGQMACFLVRALGTLVQEPGEQTSGGVYGNLTITTPGVKLKDTTVTGNLYLTGGVGLGNVELENVNVLGKIVICGGGEAEAGKQSVLLRNVTAEALELDSLSDQFLSIQAEGLTNIADVTIRTSGYLEDRTDDGLGLQTIRLDGAEGAQLQLAGNIKRVIDLTPGSSIQLAQGVADVITMDEKAVDATLTIDDRASIRELNLDRATRVDGEGDISHLNINAAGSTVSMLPDTIYIRPGITGNVSNQNMDNIAAAESSEDPRLLAGYPKAKNVAPTSADAVFSTNKTGTIHWALTALMDGSVGEEELMNPSAYPKIVRSGTLRATASNTEITARLTGLTRQGSYYISALLEDARGRRSPVKIAAFTTPDDTAPNFVTGYPQNPILTTDADNEQVAQVMVMANKDCQMYYALFPRGATAPTAADFRTGALSGNLGHGVVDLKKNTPFLVSRINTSHLQEQTQYDLYLWLNDADNGKSSAVRRVQFTTKDMTPPNILKLEPQTTADRSVTFSFELDEPGTLSWFVTRQGQSVGINKENPTRQNQIMIESALADGTRILRRGGPVRYARAGTSVTFSVTGLEGETAYDLYYMAKDTAGNYCVYNKSIEFPLPFKTRDVNGPSVEVNYSHTNPGDTEGSVVPRVDTDLRLEFSEIIRGRHDQNSDPENLLTLYQNVQNSSTANLERAKNAWGRALHGYVQLYPGTPPTRGEPTSDEVPFSDGAEVLTNPDDLPAWIDYREARIEEVGGKTTIIFPGDNDKNRSGGIAPALKLQSGASYYFRLEDIEDTTNNPMKTPPPNVVFTPRFTMAYATVHLVEEEDILTVTLPDGTVSENARVFSMTPDGTEAVPSGTRWDMVIWTSSSMRYDLLVRPAGSNGEWTMLGRVTPNPTTNNPRVYNSLNGYFKQEFLDTGLVGDVENPSDYPYLNQFTEDTPLEFAIVPVEGTYTSAVTLQIQVFAGTNSNIQRIARTQGSSIGQEVTSINEPAPYFSLSFGKPDRTPNVYVPEDGVTNLGSSIADIQVVVDDAGIVYWMAVPLGSVQPDTNGRPTGTGYTISESVPLHDGNKVNLADVPVAGVTRAPLTLDRGSPDTYNIATDDPVREAPNSTKTGNTGDDLMGSSRGTILHLRDLSAETTYLLYLVPANSDSQPVEQALCYMFTTGPAEPPVITITPSGTTAATIDVTPQSKLSYVLVNSNYFTTGSTNLVFNQPFTGSHLDGGTRALPSGWSGTVLDAMLELYPGTTHTVFDLCAGTSARTSVKNAIVYFTGTFVDPTPDHYLSERPNTTSIGPIAFTEMKGGNYYTLLAVAEDDSGNLGYKASRTYYNSTASYLRVVDVGLNITQTNASDLYNGDLTIMFSAPLHYRQYVGNQEYIRPVDSCFTDTRPQQHDLTGSSSIHLSANNYVRFDDIMNYASIPIDLTSPDKHQHEQLLNRTLTFSISNASASENGTLLISFDSQICDSGGRVRDDSPQLLIKLYRYTIPNDPDHVRWEARVDPAESAAWLRSTG